MATAKKPLFEKPKNKKELIQLVKKLTSEIRAKRGGAIPPRPKGEAAA